MRLIIALVISIRHSLRGEYGWDYKDLAELVQHVPRFNSLITIAPPEVLKILPLEIAYHLEGYIFNQKKDLIVPIINNTFANLNAIVENYTTCERILTTPIPLIYGVHIKHAMIIYLLTLPLQIIRTCGWASVVIVLLTSFTFFGIEAISSEIENPFGSDNNDLKLDAFCRQINDEINNMMKYFPSSVGLVDWLECEEIEELSIDDTATTSTKTLVNNERKRKKRLNRYASSPNFNQRRSTRFSMSIPFLRRKRSSQTEEKKILEKMSLLQEPELNEGECSSTQASYGTLDSNSIEILSKND